MKPFLAPALLLPLAAAQPVFGQHMHDARYGYTQGERVEYREDDDVLLWDLQGAYGSDLHKFAWKTEGTWAEHDTSNAELHLLYARAWTAFFDLQFGYRLADTVDGGRSYAVAGLQGLLPYRVESDLAVFLSEDGDVTGRTEFEKDFLLTERWILQPRAEIEFAVQDVPELALDAGITEWSLGLRLRYEFTRKFAPYLGVARERHYSDIAGDSDATTVLAGLRFWF